jgi:alkanesulfonate monooxygenase SsuD/methylene tetrahydromethanopterin reductase-like flavin-dependent oxidoreductase (luciferase family)
LIDFAGEGLSLHRLTDTVDAARRSDFTAISANDHFLFAAPWLDGLTALAAVVERSSPMQLMTTVALANLRGSVPLAKTLVALDILSGGRVIAGVGPGSSREDYAALGMAFEDRWRRFDEVLRQLKAVLQSEGATGTDDEQDSSVGLSPPPARRGGIPVWIGSWGSSVGLRRVARTGDGWLASAYNTTPEDFAKNLMLLGNELERHNRSSEDFPHALVTMWTSVTDRSSETERVLSQILGPLVRRDPAELRARVCVGSPEHCAELLARYAQAGCQRIFFWPIGDEPRQIERIAGEVLPLALM